MKTLLTCLLVGTFSTADALAETVSCPLLSEKIDDAQMQLLDLKRAREELEAKFKDVIVDDAKVVSGNLLGEFQQNESIKVNFTRRKLLKSIDEKSAAQKALKDEYCVRCVNSLKNEFAKASFCAKCPGKIECDPKPEEDAKDG